jgi:hypothetical protein
MQGVSLSELEMAADLWKESTHISFSAYALRKKPGASGHQNGIHSEQLTSQG